MLFDTDSLANIHIPVLLIGTPEDRQNKPDTQSAMLSAGLVNTRVESAILSGADSLSLMALCPPRTCRQPAGLLLQFRPRKTSETGKRACFSIARLS